MSVTLFGKYKDGKIHYTSPIVNFLTGGNWKTGFSGVGRSGGDTVEYDIINETDEVLEENKFYYFEIVDEKNAKIVGKSKHHKSDNEPSKIVKIGYDISVPPSSHQIWDETFNRFIKEKSKNNIISFLDFLKENFKAPEKL